MQKRRRTLRSLALVWLAPDTIKRRYPFLNEMALVFLGELKNMRGHCAVAGVKNGRIYALHETALFTQLEVRPVK